VFFNVRSKEEKVARSYNAIIANKAATFLCGFDYPI
jgi:hypothetical protein